MKRSLPVIRVFVSSTFSDLKHERNALQAKVWPELERYCQQRGFTFQAIDLRWGVPAEAGLDHRTMRICFEELRRSQQTSPEPNFLILLGNRYGWRPLPEVISVDEFKELKTAAQQIQRESPDPSTQLSEKQAELLRKAALVLEDWYLLDENAKPFGEKTPLGEYVLRTRKTLLRGVDYGKYLDADDTSQDTTEWVDVQFVLWAIVNRAFPAEGLRERFAPSKKSRDQSIVRFQSSATEQEIWHGALQLDDLEAKQHVVAWFRAIENLDVYPPGAQLKDFVDLRSDGTPDQVAKQALEQLTSELKDKLDPENVLKAKCRWDVQERARSAPDVTTAHLNAMCERIRGRLEAIIIRQINAYWGCDLGAADATLAQVRGSRQELDLECADHLRFAGERAPEKTFVGRESELQRIRDYLRSETNQPFVVHGPSGSGKTALLGKIIQEVTPSRSADGMRAQTGPIVLARFIGTTPESSNLRSLFSSLCRELRQDFEMPAPLPADMSELIDEFYSQLGKSTAARPVFVFLDALDQLDAADYGQSVSWIRSPLPSTGHAFCHARLVVSCLSPSDEFPEDSEACEPFRQLKLCALLGRHELGALDENHARQLLANWLHDARRGVSETQQNMIWTVLRKSSTCRRPLFLKALFEEAKLWRSYDTDVRLYEPETSNDHVGAMLKQLFDRLSLEENHGKLLVERALGYIAAARHGLTETEILEVLFADRECRRSIVRRSIANKHRMSRRPKRIPIAYWSRLRSDLAPYLTERAALGGNVLTLYHRQIDKWTKDRFVGKAVWNPHLRLGRYFDGEADPKRDHGFSGRTRALVELPYHLDAAGEDAWAIARLRELPDTGFVSKKIERTYDLRGVSDDFRYFVKARLRAQDYVGVLSLAASRAGLAGLTEFVSGTHLGKLAPLMSADSRLWLGILNAIASLGTANERVEHLTAFVQPGLEPTMYESLRGHFRRDAPEASEGVQREFLQALAHSQAGAIDYIFSFRATLSLSEELASELAKRIRSLCLGATVSEEEATESLADWAATDGGVLVALADGFGQHEDREVAIRGMVIVEKRIAGLSASKRFSDCAAALSHGLARHENWRSAERLAKQCFERLPPKPEDRLSLDWIGFGEAAWRLAMAAAPFPALWSGARPVAMQMLDCLEERLNQASTLAGFIRVTPWIASATARNDWLREILRRIVQLVGEDVGREDHVLQFLSMLGGDSPETQLAEPIQQALLELLADIDRVLPGEAPSELLGEILLSAAQVDASVRDDPKAMVAFFKKALPELMKSNNPLALGFAVTFFIETTAAANLLSGSTAQIFQVTIHDVIARNDESWCKALLEALYECAERVWLPKNKHMSFVFAAALLQGIAGKRSAAGGRESQAADGAQTKRRDQLFTAFQDRLLAWKQGADPKNHDAVTVLWAGTLIALGKSDEGNRMLHSIPSKLGGRLPTRLLASMADILISAGQGQEATSLLHDLLPSQAQLDDHDRLDESLLVARRLVSASGDSAPAARQFLLDAARSYRRDVDRLSLDVQALLLNRCFDLQDRQLAIDFVQLAEREMIDEPAADSTMAGLWYAAMALACIGDVSAANEVRSQLSDWPRISTSAAVRRRVLAIQLGTSAKPPIALLDELMQLLDAIEDEETRCDALVITAVLPAYGPASLFEQTIELLLDGLDRMADNPGLLATVLESLCERLKGADSQTAIRVLTSIFDFVDRRSDSERRELGGYAHTFLERAFALAKSQSGDAPCAALIRRVVGTASACGISEIPLTEIVEFAFGRLPVDQAITALDGCLALARTIGADAKRRPVLQRLIVAAISSCPVHEVDALALRLDDESTGDGDDVLIHLCRVYKCLVHRGGSAVYASELEYRIRRNGPPSIVRDQVDWLTTLTDTNLSALAAPIADDLFNHLDRFAADNRTCESLGRFLKAAIPSWPRSEIGLRFARLLDWVSSMPLVSNEDARPRVLQQLMDATVAVPISDRDPIQVAVLERTAAIPGKRSLPSLPLRGTGPRALDSYVRLMAAAAPGDPAKSDSAYDVVIALAIRACTAKVDDATVHSLCAVLDKFDRRPTNVQRSYLATAVERCGNIALKARLTPLLEQAFKASGCNDLTLEELFYLADRPVAWWIEQSAATTSTIDDKALKHWIVEVFQRNPHLGPLAVALGSFWLSTQGLDRLDEFCFELATSTSIPLQLRRHVAMERFGEVKQEA